MGRINELLAKACDAEQPEAPKATGKVEPTVEHTNARMMFIIDTGMGTITERQMDVIKSALQSQMPEVKLTVRPSCGGRIECQVESIEIIEKIKNIATSAIGVIAKSTEDILETEDGKN